MEGLKKRNKGITLIALVVTIVVLLILATVSISMIAGENGIITQAQDAKLESRAGNVREEVDLWKTENTIRKNNNQQTISKENMLTDLKNKGILYEEEIDRENEIIIIGKNEIPYGTEVVINIKKTPETELSSVVILKVISVEGLGENIQLDSEVQYIGMLLSKLNSLEIEEWENLFVDVINFEIALEGIGIQFENFNDYIQYMYENGELEENSKEAFYQKVEDFGGIGVFNEQFAYKIFEINYNFIGEFNKETGNLIPYAIKNPANKNKDYYIATENGNYTFTVEDTITGKIYTKTINVSNIRKNDNYYVKNIDKFYIGLLENDSNIPTIFDKAFILYGGEKVDITDLIITKNNVSKIYGFDLKRKFGREIEGVQDFLLQKDNIFYYGEAMVIWEE